MLCITTRYQSSQPTRTTDIAIYVMHFGGNYENHTKTFILRSQRTIRIRLHIYHPSDLNMMMALDSHTVGLSFV